MSDIRFSCPQCQRHLQGDEGYAGRQIVCPSCGTTVTVPGAAPAPMAAAAPVGVPRAVAAPAPMAAPPRAAATLAAPVAAPPAPPMSAPPGVMSYRPARGGGGSKAKAPGIALLVLGILWVLYAAWTIVAGMAMDPKAIADQAMAQQHSAGLQPAQAAQVQNATDMIAKFGKTVVVVFGVVSALVGLGVLLGGLQMMRLRSRGLALTGAILAMVPVSPFCLLGLPFGIWALVVLRKPEVKAAFG